MSRPSERAEILAGGGERDLGLLLRSMRPVLREPVYLFLTVKPEAGLPDGVHPILEFQETEGTTCIVEREAAEAAGLDGIFPCRQITLEVHSSLDAIGFLAAVTARLAGADIGVNPVAGFYHDHLFVPVDRAEAALCVLEALAAEATGETQPE